MRSSVDLPEPLTPSTPIFASGIEGEIDVLQDLLAARIGLAEALHVIDELPRHIASQREIALSLEHFRSGREAVWGLDEAEKCPRRAVGGIYSAVQALRSGSHKAQNRGAKGAAREHDRRAEREQRDQIQGQIGGIAGKRQNAEDDRRQSCERLNAG